MDEGDAYRVADLFSGAGGLSIGFDTPESLNGLEPLGYTDIGHDAPGFESVLAVEGNKDATQTYLQNFADGNESQYYDIDPEDALIDYARLNTDSLTVVHGDISWINFANVPCDVDVVIGGPPCQGFSQMNQTSLEDLRVHDEYAEMNQLWEYFLLAVEHLDPEVFLIENVGRFLNSIEAARAWNRATALGYTLTADIKNAKQYGVPQNRSRGFILGSKHGRPPFPDPICGDGTDEPVRTVRDAIGDLPADPDDNTDTYHCGRRQSDKTKARMKVLPKHGDTDTDRPADRRGLVVDPETYEYNDLFEVTHEDDLLPNCWSGEHSGHTDHYGRLHPDKPAVTIRTGFTQPMKGRHVHYEAPRALTPREGARLQTFPDDFEFSDDSSKNSVTTQIGNAVPPKMAYELARAIHDHLTNGRVADELPKMTRKLEKRAGKLQEQSTLDSFTIS